ncbi:MAG TPA: hypothetical protein VHC41_02400 [Mycobacteriales bacterium]|nr:hypothetical protein [Mycobacteriales bacterium]
MGGRARQATRAGVRGREGGPARQPVSAGGATAGTRRDGGDKVREAAAVDVQTSEHGTTVLTGPSLQALKNFGD